MAQCHLSILSMWSWDSVIITLWFCNPKNSFCTKVQQFRSIILKLQTNVQEGPNYKNRLYTPLQNNDGVFDVVTNHASKELARGYSKDAARTSPCLVFLLQSISYFSWRCMDKNLFVMISGNAIGLLGCCKLTIIHQTKSNQTIQVFG